MFKEKVYYSISVPWMNLAELIYMFIARTAPWVSKVINETLV